MSDLQLTTDGDLDVSGGDMGVVRDEANDPAAVAQRLRIKLRTFRGEWFLDRAAGVPYYQYILGTKPNVAVVDSVFTRAILETPGVKELSGPISYTLDRRAREITVSFTCKAIDGSAIEIEEAFP